MPLRPFIIPVVGVALAASIVVPEGGVHAAEALRKLQGRIDVARLTVAGTPSPGTATASSTAVPREVAPSAAMERLKQLVGTWDSQESERQSRGRVDYRLTGGGNVLVEDMGGMMSTYHLDGGKLMVTHYCGAGNQPRMRASELSSGKMSFKMFDITNLKSPQSYHTTNVQIVFVSESRVDVTFRGTTDGQPSSQTFQLTRRKT